MNLLIVDDEYLVVEEVVTVTDWGMLGITEIYSATNAVSAVRILNEKKIDIMICDIEMPQTDGLESLTDFIILGNNKGKGKFSGFRNRHVDKPCGVYLCQNCLAIRML